MTQKADALAPLGFPWDRDRLGVESVIISVSDSLHLRCLGHYHCYPTHYNHIFKDIQRQVLQQITYTIFKYHYTLHFVQMQSTSKIFTLL